MGREEENRRPWCGQAALARPTPHRVSGAALGGPHGAVYFPSGTKGQQPLVFPASDGLRGRASTPIEDRSRRARPRVCHVAHLTRGSSPVRAETPARWLGRRNRADRAVPGRVAP